MPTVRPAPPVPAELPVHDEPLAELDPVTLYRILQLRTDIFVVEQDCPYPELDGRDLEPDARHLWIAENGAVLATLRVLGEPDGDARIGRVATAAAARSRGLAARLLQHALAGVGDRDVVIDAQAQLHDWYARFGFVRAGADFVEDGIRHVPMRRDGSRAPDAAQAGAPTPAPG